LECGWSISCPFVFVVGGGWQVVGRHIVSIGRSACAVQKCHLCCKPLALWVGSIWVCGRACMPGCHVYPQRQTYALLGPIWRPSGEESFGIMAGAVSPCFAGAESICVTGFTRFQSFTGRYGLKSGKYDYPCVKILISAVRVC